MDGARVLTSVPVQVLLVEDEDSDAEVVRRFLSWAKRESFQVTRAESCQAAVNSLRSKSFDVVLLDLRLTDSDEHQTFEAVHAVAPETPVVVLTGTGSEELGPALVGKGAQDFLVKGRFDVDHLQRAIRYAIERQRLVQELDRARARADREREDEILERIARHTV